MNKILLILGLIFSIYSYGANAPTKSKTDNLEKLVEKATYEGHPGMIFEI